MKSQFYHEIQVLQTFPKKRKKQTPPPPQLSKSIHPTRCRPSRSEKRSMISSVDLRTLPREPQPHTTMLRSKALPPSLDIEHCAQWIEVKCIDCESLRAESSKKMKELQMKFEEEFTECKQNCVQMEKKYLHKQHELISFMNDYQKVLEDGEIKEQQISKLKQQNILLKEQCFASQTQNASLVAEIEALMIDKKVNSEKLQNMHYFLKLYQQQTKVVLSWARILNKIQEQADALQLLRQQILSRKFDCEVTLKQAITFEKLNFSEIPHSSEQTSFFEEDSSCQNFMRYLRQEGSHDKTRIFMKPKQNSSEQRWQNKQNIDNANIAPMKSLLNSRKKQQKRIPKAEIETQSMLRILLAQAKTMEKYSKVQSSIIIDNPILQNSHISLQRSVICK